MRLSYFFDDANLDAALDNCVAVKFSNEGQVCVTGDRFHVHEALQQKFVDGFAAKGKALKLNHGLENATQMGPLINSKRVAAIDAMYQTRANSIIISMLNWPR